MPYVGLVHHSAPMSIYTENGYANRKEYLDELREEYGSDMVNTLITVLPASEDFDGLVTVEKLAQPPDQTT
jgi:hypothetical protein